MAYGHKSDTLDDGLRIANFDSKETFGGTESL